MKRNILACSLALALGACASTEPEQPFTLTVAHINDTHSHFDAIPGQLQFEGRSLFTRFGGHPRLLARADQLRRQAEADDQSLLFVHGGDAWQGTGYFKLNNGAMNADVLSRMELDAMALGNHEFDLDNARLAAFIERLSFPVLAANLDASEDPDLAGQENLKPYVLYAFNGVEKRRLDSLEDADDDPVVAVMGLVLEDMPDISPQIGALRFGQEVAGAQQTVDALQAMGVNKIVAITHLGLERDQRLAREVNGIDLIVGGHSHTLMGDFSNLGLARGERYAQQIGNPDGQGKTCVVQAGQYAQAMGQVAITFDGQGQLTACDGQNTLLADNRFYGDIRQQPQDRLDKQAEGRVRNFVKAQPNIALVEEDAALREHIDGQYRPALEQAYGDLIGQVPATLQHVRLPGEDGSDSHGSKVAPLVAASQLYWVNRPEVQALTGRHIDFALVGAGSVRNNLEQGEFREGNASLELLPFGNALSLLSLTGQQVAALLIDVVNQSLPEGAHTGKFPYSSGLRYQFNETQPGKGYIGQLEYLADGQWQRIQPNKLYHVVMSSYSASGNDGWEALFRAQEVLSDRLDLAYVNERLTVFPVARLSKTAGGKVQVHYANGALDCSAKGVRCNTDAQAFIDYVRDRRPVLTPLAEPTVTLNRL
ncbi:bifunctional metallophosphatase/5'-nucleotidase [Zobellella aerophila]|uniref:Bifunctional metallophosphatase/5'-nucleotidase n=1 Tax=Zobellella aerophila TaxID=870480 RepID=A0ABP6VCY1_9GAMM